MNPPPDQDRIPGSKTQQAPRRRSDTELTVFEALCDQDPVGDVARRHNLLAALVRKIRDAIPLQLEPPGTGS